MNAFIQNLKTAIVLLLLLSLITGFFYPLLMTGFASMLFPWKSNGSILTEQGTSVGSQWIGQSFTLPGYFWGRPPAAPALAYNGINSGGSNLAPSNPLLVAKVKQNIELLMPAQAPIPVDLVTSSGSGLDPDISPKAALYQVPRVAAQRHLPEALLVDLINRYTLDSLFGLIGQPRVNVLELNRALDALGEKSDSRTKQS